MAVVWGKYETQARLKEAEEEGKTLTARYKARHVNARWGPVTELLEGTPPAQIMHFAVHGTYNPDETDQEGIHLVNDDLILPDDIAVAKLRTSAPFVFLNACQLGSSSTSLDSYYGTAPSFLRAGASAVVAPLWSVDDGTAREISLRFYRRALDAKPDDPPLIGELIREVRAEIGKKPRTATYLAYQFYGHPSLRLSWTPTAPGGTTDG
jgi:CHAT domain-containing protein